MPVLFWGTWPHIVLRVALAFMLDAPWAPFEVLRNIAVGDYPPRF